MTPRSIQLSIPGKLREVPFQGSWAGDWTIDKSLAPSIHFNSQAGQEKWFGEGWLLTWGHRADLGFESDTGPGLPTVPEPRGLLRHVLASHCQRPMADCLEVQFSPKEEWTVLRDRSRTIWEAGGQKQHDNKAKWYQGMLSNSRRGAGQG